MLTKLKGYLWACAGAVMVGLIIVIRWLDYRLDKAREKALINERRAEAAEARIKQREAAQKASDEAKVKGDEKVKQAVDNARNGDRSHFERKL